MAPFVFIVSLIPGFAWTFFFLQEDDHPEPPRLLLLVFIGGMLGALGIASVGIIIRNQLFSGQPDLTIPYLTITALLEEVGKFEMVYVLVRNRPAFDEPVDAMVYMVVGALGFATLENIGYLSQEAARSPLFGSVIEVASLRFVGSTLLHALSSGFVGYFWALSIRRFSAPIPIIFGLGVATVLHTYFNYLIITYGNIFYLLILLVTAGILVLHDFEDLKEKLV
jgi:RsiW-degrading membrane proteinase PrsW (M82 family)